jgi:hypothetical protein
MVAIKIDEADGKHVSLTSSNWDRCFSRAVGAILADARQVARALVGQPGSDDHPATRLCRQAKLPAQAALFR